MEEKGSYLLQTVVKCIFLQHETDNFCMCGTSNPKFGFIQSAPFKEVWGFLMKIDKNQKMIVVMYVLSNHKHGDMTQMTACKVTGHGWTCV